MPDPGWDMASTLRASVRGLIAAMAMSGMRELTANVGLLEKSPPKVILERHAPKKVKHLATEHRSAIIELAHWCYGTAGGAIFGLLPRRLRAAPWIGPVYGLSIWLVFELGIGPLLDVQYPEQRRLSHRIMLALDHMMYGIVVAGRLAPASEVRA